MESMEIDLDNTAKLFWKSLYLQDEGDLTIRLSDESTMKVISYVLKHKSTVFQDMLNAEMIEKINSTIDMTIYDPLLVKCFFAYIYFNGVYNGDDIDIFFDLIDMAELYKVNELCTKLKEKIIKRINYDTIQKILTNCKKHGDICDEIYRVGIEFVRLNAFASCYDNNYKSNDVYGWCCKHRDKYAADNYNYYTVSGNYACICYNLKRRCGVPNTSLTYDVEGKSIPYNAYTDRCCLHRKKMLNFDMLKDLDITIKDDILKSLFT